jgi:outer membrane protein assembly factor BamB
MICANGSKDAVFALDSSAHQILALHMKEGVRLWTYAFQDLSINLTTVHLVPASSDGVEDFLYFSADAVSSETGQIFALRTSDGSQVWHSNPIGDTSHPQPIVPVGVTLATGDVVYANNGPKLLAFRADTGDILWQKQNQSPIGEMMVFQGILVGTYCSDSALLGGCDIFVASTTNGKTYWDDGLDAKRGTFALAIG